MIQPNELRLENWVYDILADVNVEVIGIDQYEIFTEDIGGVQEICNCKDIEPIPLTDEFCTKQGLVKGQIIYTKLDSMTNEELICTMSTGHEVYVSELIPCLDEQSKP